MENNIPYWQITDEDYEIITMYNNGNGYSDLIVNFLPTSDDHPGYHYAFQGDVDISETQWLNSQGIVPVSVGFRMSNQPSILVP